MSAHKSLITIDKRILLHLSNNHISKHKIDMPIALTKNGIAQAVGANYCYVSMLVNELLAEEHVCECFGRVERGSKKQKYYLLTDKGEEHAQKLKNKLSNLQIRLKQQDGSFKIMPLKDIVPYLNKKGICRGVTELDICRVTTRDHTLDIKHLKNIKKTSLLDFSADMPTVMRFFGRKKELTLLKSWVEDNERHNIIFMCGMPGIGKTTLAAKLVEKYLGSKHLFWHNFRNLDTLRGVLFKLAKFLSKLRHDHLEIYLRTHRSLDHNDVSTILGKSIGVIDAMLIFDDFHKSNDEIRDFFAYILGMLTSKSNTKVLIISREFVPFYGRRDVFKREIVAELELEGLDFESSKRLLKGRGIDKSKFKEVYALTAGNPLYLEIFDSKDDLDRYMHDEIFLRFEDDERKILGIVSTYRFPVSEDCLIMNDIDPEKLYDLTRKSIVKKDAHDRYFLHDIVKQFFYRWLSHSKRRKHHLLAAQWYENRDDAIDLIEAVYHYQEAEDYKRASQFAIDSSTFILDSGYATELLVTLERFDEKNVDARVWPEILILKGKACNVGGEWKKALLYLSESADIATILDDNELKVKAICESGHILEEQNQFDKAMKYFKKCLDISQKTDFPQGIGNGYRGIGRIHWRKSRHEEAISNIKKCIEVSKNSGNLDLVASAYIDLGNVHDERYETKKAIEYYNKALDILKNVKNVYETARAHTNLAVTYRHLEKFDEAIDCYTKSLVLGQDFRDIRRLGYDYAGISYCFAKIDEFESAREYAKKAEDIALKIDNNNIMFDVYRTYAFIYKHEKKWDEAVRHFQKGIEIVEKLRAHYYLSDAHFEFGLLYKEMGDTKNAKKHFDIATNLYDKLGLGEAELVKEKLSKYRDREGSNRVRQ